MAKKPENRVELDERLRKNGVDGKLFKNEESRDKAKWILKKIRLGDYRKTVNL